MSRVGASPIHFKYCFTNRGTGVGGRAQAGPYPSAMINTTSASKKTKSSGETSTDNSTLSSMKVLSAISTKVSLV